MELKTNWGQGTGYGELRIGANIAERLLKLGANSLRVAERLPRKTGGRHIAAQLVRSGTAGGAIYEEARAAESRADFIHKIRIAAKEVRETLYWLKLVRQVGLLATGLD